MQNGVETCHSNLSLSNARQATVELSGHSLSTAHACRTLRKSFLQHLHNNELILSTNTEATSDDNHRFRQCNNELVCKQKLINRYGQ